MTMDRFKQRLQRIGVPSMIFLVLAFFFCRPIEDYDIWFHMVVGREIVESGKIPDQMFYLLPLMGEPRSFIEWGFGLTYHLIYVLTGFVGMALLNAILGAGALFFAYRSALLNRSLLNPVAILVLACIAYWIKFRINYRAEGFLYLAIGLEIWILERYLIRNNWHWLAAIPAIGWVLIQLHPSVIFLLPILGAYAADQIITPTNNQSRLSIAGRFSLAGITTLVVACINPLGWHQVTLPIQAIFSSNSSWIDITEYAPIMDTNLSGIFLASTLIGLVSVIFQSQRRVAYGLLLVFFGLLTYQYVRNFGLFCLILLAPAVRFALQISPSSLKPNYQYTLATMLLAGLISLPFWQGEWGIGPKPELFPKHATAKLQQSFPNGTNVLNFFDYGGYLAWSLPSSFKLFVDGSDTKVNRAVELHDAIFRADAGWEKKLAELKIDAIFTPAVMQYSGKNIPLIEQLAHNNNWILTSRESSGMLFLRNTHAQIALDKREIWAQMILEANREIKAYPTHPDPWESLAMANFYLGNAAQSEQAAKQFKILIEKPL